LCGINGNEQALYASLFLESSASTNFDRVVMTNSEYSPASSEASPVRRLLIPSIAAAGVVFGLSLFVLGTHKADWFERVAKVRAEDNQRDYSLTNRGRDTAIRVVGTAIVLSVATGIGMVEVLRKWYAVRDRSAAIEQDVALSEFVDNFVDDEVASITHLPITHLSVANPSVANIPITSIPITNIPIPEMTAEVAFMEMAVQEQTETEKAAAWEALWQPEPPTSELASTLESLVLEPPTLADRSPTAVPLVDGTYHIDRQVVPGSLHTQLVLHHDDRVYRFLRSAETLDLLNRYWDVYLRRNIAIVVTPLVAGPDSGYGLWEGV
jgi:hypothetical protein